MNASRILALLLVCSLAAACGETKEGVATAPNVKVVASNLMNPSSVSFSDDGLLTICDSGNGRVVVVRDGKVEDYITGFDTEYWKVDKEAGTKRFKLGPLSAIWLGKTLVVSDGGKKDGRETLLFFTGPGEAKSGAATNALVPEGVPVEKGEGNLSGMAATKDQKQIFLCGQGSDDKSWVVACDVASKKLTAFASADDNGIKVNSPMQIIDWDDSSILALYSGKGGAEDGLIVKWDKKTAKALGQWNLKGLWDPMGMARRPGSDELIVVDNNWSLTEVKDGRIATVNLGADGKVDIKTVDVALKGPVSCTFGPDGHLYVAQLGDMYDEGKGQVLQISGL